ncbi:MAG: hypothetical protein H0A75_05685 [Candidatus Methanofishera endochildressiae]|uniref:Uncharacterized protein n=1 Tax=Candidatus Methanofishera endochildressiae TaxID=2738884 RepID=A0A7Z0MNW1_9GAMM|nr:hypothetical protein [Candidatus Methanofishera endochildressiae]
MLAFQMGSWGYQSHSTIRSAKMMADKIRPYSEQAPENIRHQLFEYQPYITASISVVDYRQKIFYRPGDCPASEAEFCVWLQHKSVWPSAKTYQKRLNKYHEHHLSTPRRRVARRFKMKPKNFYPSSPFPKRTGSNPGKASKAFCSRFSN